MWNKIVEEMFRYRIANHSSLLKYGFKQENLKFVYECKIVEDSLLLKIIVNEDNTLTIDVIEIETKEPYILYLVESATGSFIGKVREAYLSIVRDVCEKCFELDVFRGQAKEIIQLVQTLYGDALEFLWEKYIDTAIWRRKDNQKWYGLIVNVKGRRIGLESDELVTVLNVRIQPELLEVLIESPSYYLAYHMNKKHWVSILLDNSLSLEELKKRIEDSYNLALK